MVRFRFIQQTAVTRTDTQYEKPKCVERLKEEVWMPLTSLPLSVFLHGLWNFLLMYPSETCAILVESGQDIDGDRVALKRL